MTAIKTNAMRILDKEGISYRSVFYEVDEGDLSGQKVAQQIGLPEEAVFKTLVLRGERLGVSVCCLPVPEEIDLKRFAQAAGDKNMEMVAQKELLTLTGYIRGGVSPIGMKKKYPLFFDELVTLYEEIAISGGARGCQLLVNPLDVITFLDAVIIDATRRGEA